MQARALIVISWEGTGKKGLTDLRLTNLSGLWGVAAVLGCLVLGLGVFRARNSGPECESLKKMCLGCGLWIVGSYLKSVLSSESFILS